MLSLVYYICSPLKSATVKGTAKPDSKTTRSKHRQETESIISISSGSEDSTAPIKGQKGKGKRQSVGKSGNTSSVVRIKQERQETHASKAESDHREMDSESKSHANDRSKKSRYGGNFIYFLFWTTSHMSVN